MGWYKCFTPEQKEHVELLASIGFNDVKITSIIKIGHFVVAQITTEYWHNKMRKAYDWYNY